MGKNLVTQARGKGSPTYRSPSFRFEGSISYPKLQNLTVTGKIQDIIHCQGHSAPLAQIIFENGENILNVANEGIRVGDSIMIGETAEIKPGNVAMLKSIPEGTLVSNLESQPGDGGKFCRTSGAFAKVLARLSDRVIVLLPSKKEREFIPDCRATIGIVAGGGRTEKPLIKAGIQYHRKQAKNKLYPHVSGTSQNALDHPFGGSRSSRKGRPSTAPKFAPPGRNVGLLHARRTGRRKRN